MRVCVCVVRFELTRKKKSNEHLCVNVHEIRIVSTTNAKRRWWECQISNERIVEKE